MADIRLSKKVIVQSLSPLLIVILTVIGSEIFSSATQKWGDSIIQGIGGRIILLIILFLLAGILSFYILLRSQSKSTTQSDSNNTITDSEIRKNREHLLCNLAEDEKETLRHFINGKKKNISITYGYGNVSSLLQNGIISCLSQISVGGLVEYVISDWAWEMLNKNSEYLK